MNALTTQVRKIFIIAGILFIGMKAGMAQQGSTAKNFAGISGSVLWNTSSVSAGVMGERIIASKQHTELSVKASYTFRHRFGNLVLLFSTPYDDITSAEAGLGISGYLFTGKQKTNTGFFLSAGAGAMYSHWKFDTDSESYIRPAGELGLGFKWRLNDNMAIRWSNDIKWASPQPEGGGAVITTTTLAFGF